MSDNTKNNTKTQMLSKKQQKPSYASPEHYDHDAKIYALIQKLHELATGETLAKNFGIARPNGVAKIARKKKELFK